MSLLLDAMKRAELAKRQAEASAQRGGADAAADTAPAASDAPPAAAPEAAQATSPSASPVAAAELSLAEDRPPQTAARSEPGGRPRGGGEAAGREAAQLLFASKEPARDRRGFYLWLALATAAATLALVAWTWWQMQAGSSIAVPPQPGEGERAPSRTAVREVQSPPPAVPAAVPGDTQRPATEAGTPPVRHHHPVAAPRRQDDTPAPPPPDVPVRITRTRHAAIHPGVAAGYQALQAGDVASARRAYLSALRDEPRNVDALQGLAAIALREGRERDAAGLYRRILEIAPRDAHALAALANLPGADENSESELKSLLAAQPDAASARFALGNVLAAQQRWREAQQAYFDAYNDEPGNPDYLFNLAVSLDHLHQSALAAQYYRAAIDAARQHPAAFDPALARQRLADIETQKP